MLEKIGGALGFGSSKPVNPQTWKAGDPVPAGFKEQRNKTTGQRRIVPAGP